MNPPRTILQNAPRRLLAPVCILFAASFSWAQVAANMTPDAATLAKYDKNKNGKLDPDELAAMSADQTQAPGAVTTAKAPEPADETVQLSPFEVKAEDNGYNAANAMSITRVNSKLEDLGASISVVTKQQLVDTAAVDINDIFLYEANTEGTGQFTASQTDVNGLTIDTVQSSPQTANRVRGIGAADITVGGFSSNSRIPVDTYNLDSVEISRGPNSNLAGLGGGSGTVNLNQASGNLNREITQATFRGDSWGGYRSTISLNRPVIKNKLAFQVDLLYDNKGFIRKPSGDLQRRQYVTATYRLFQNTKLSASAEFMTDNRQTPNAQTPRDTISFWLQNGKPTWDPITQTVHYPDGRPSISVGTNDALLPSGLGLDTTQYTRPSMYLDNTGAIQLWTPNRNSTTGLPNNTGGAARMIGTYTDISRSRATLYPLFTPPSVSNKALYDWDKINFSSTNWNQDKAATYNVSLDQQIFRTGTQQLYMNAAYRREMSSTYNHNLIGTTSFLYLDINERLLDGRVNPYFMRPYVTVWEPTIGKNSDLNDQTRTQLSYQLDLGRKNRWLSWIGRQQLVGFYETRFTTSQGFSSREAILDPHTWLSSANYANGNAQGRVSYKYYLGDNQGYNVDYAAPKGGTTTGVYNFHYVSNPTTLTTVDEPALFGETPSAASRTRTNLWTHGINLQSFFFDDRIVTLLGYRRDNKAVRGSPGINPNPATGLYTWADIDTHGWNAWSYRAGNTKTTDLVVRPFKGIPFIDRQAENPGFLGYVMDGLRTAEYTYNQSNSFNPTSGTPNKNLLGDLLPEPNGRTVERGLQIQLMKNKLWASVIWYRTTSKDARVQGGASTAVGRTQQLDTGTSSFALYTWARNVVLARPAAASQTDAQITADTYKLMQLPNGWFDQFSGFNLSDTNDILSTGKEFNINYSPSPNLRLKFTAAQTKAISSNLSGANQAYIDMRLPAWTTIKDDSGNLWWTATTANVWYNSFIIPTFKLSRALLGLPNPQTKEWSWSAIGNYTFGPDSWVVANGGPWGAKLKGVSVGTAIRWADKSAIGFYGVVDPDGIMRTYDRTRPVFDPARTSYDFNASYRMRLFESKIGARFQLNVRDAFSHRGSLRAVAVQPDGTPANFRIIDGPQWIFTTTFDL